jgi:pimeloyl-ACP methyl ester carboxylesterase
MRGSSRRAFAPPEPLEERWLDRPRRLRYLIGGDGPPLLLCHGFIGSAENFESWVSELSTRRTLVIPDLPGCGVSPALPGRHTSAAMARSLTPLIEQLELDRFDLGGLCLGSGVAFELLARWPDRVGRVVLHTPLLDPSVVRLRHHLQSALLLSPPIYPIATYLGRQRWFSDLYKLLIVEGGDVDPHLAEMNFQNQVRCEARAQQEWLLSGLRRRDAGLLAGHGDETLVIVAGRDRILDEVALRRLVAPMERVHLASIDDAGHGWNQDFVRSQLDLLSAFLDGLPIPSVTAAA